MRIDLVFVSGEGHASFSHITRRNHLDYARARGYNFREFIGVPGKRLFSWEKWGVINQVLKNSRADWVVWADPGCYYTSTESGYEYYLDKLPGDKKIVTGFVATRLRWHFDVRRGMERVESPFPYIANIPNSKVMAFRPCDETRAFTERLPLDMRFVLDAWAAGHRLEDDLALFLYQQEELWNPIWHMMDIEWFWDGPEAYLRMKSGKEWLGSIESQTICHTSEMRPFLGIPFCHMGPFEMAELIGIYRAKERGYESESGHTQQQPAVLERPALPQED